MKYLILKHQSKLTDSYLNRCRLGTGNSSYVSFYIKLADDLQCQVQSSIELILIIWYYC